MVYDVSLRWTLAQTFDVCSENNKFHKRVTTLNDTIDWLIITLMRRLSVSIIFKSQLLLMRRRDEGFQADTQDPGPQLGS